MAIKRLSTILCVDDEEDMLSLLARALESMLECRVFTCAKGVEAVEKAQLHMPDLILLDVLMPGMNGLAVLRSLKQQEQTQAIPVVFITACSEPSERAHYLAQGAAGIIDKPFDPIGVAREVGTLWQSMRSNGFAGESERGFFLQLRELRPELASFMRYGREGHPAEPEVKLLQMRLQKLRQAGTSGRHAGLLGAAALLAQKLGDDSMPEACAQASALLEAALDALTFSGAAAAGYKALPFIDGAKPRLLVADDDRIVAEMMHQLFAESTELYIARDGNQAFEMNRVHAPHLMILDDFMPGMTGLKLVEKLHALGGPPTPVLMLTGSDRPQEVMRAMQAGVADYIIKPFNPADLRDKVEAQLLLLINSQQGMR